jgi:hypothetical protein
MAQPSTALPVTIPTLVSVTTSSPLSSRYSVMISLKRISPPRRPSFSQLLPGCELARSTTPGRSGWWYSKRCSPWSTRVRLGPPPPPRFAPAPFASPPPGTSAAGIRRTPRRA